MERVFVDTGLWYALNDARDPAHQRAVSALEANALPLVTSNVVLWESVTLLRYKLGHAQAMRFGSELLEDARVSIVRVTEEDEREAWKLFCRYDDKRLSMADCTCFAVMRRLHIHRAMTFDGDFRRMGFETQA